MTGSEWADKYFYLSPESAANPGKWRTFPYQKEILDAITDPEIEEVWVKKSARMGFTKILDIAIGYYLHQDPCPILFVQPTVEDGQGASKEEIDPMLRDVPVLSALQSDQARRGVKTKDNTILLKTFKGPNGIGLLHLVGANSPRGFRRVSRRVVLMDEVNGWPLSAGKEGDQVALAKKRANYYTNRKIFGGSTPTIEGLSRIETEIKDTDRRRRFVPCPRCGHMQPLVWGGKDADFGVKWRDKDPATAVYLCEKCHQFITPHEVRLMDAHGEWQPTQKGSPKKRGYDGLWSIYSYSPNNTLPDLVAEYLESRKIPEKEIVFRNTVLGLDHKEEGIQTDAKALAKLLRPGWKPYEVPPAAALLIQTVDAQGKWLEAQTIAIAPTGPVGKDGTAPPPHAWLVDHDVIPFGPQDPEAWRLLEEWRNHPRLRLGTGEPIKPEICLIDSNFEVDAVIHYVRPRSRLKVFACRGMEKIAADKLVKRGQTTKERHLQYQIATWEYKKILQRRLAIGDDRPGRIYLPEWVSDDYLEQITAERLVTTKNRRTGREKQEWIKTRDRNEALDLWVYALAAYTILQEFYGRRKYTNLAAIHKSRFDTDTEAQKPETPDTEAQKPKPNRPVARRPELPAHRRRY
jgi:phage terminase large subunit GpA-like protein